MSDVIKRIVSTADGLSTDSVLLGPGEWVVYILAPDWDSSKKVQLHGSPTGESGTYVADRSDVGGGETVVFTATENISVSILGGRHMKLHLANAGTGATVYFRLGK